MTVRKTLVSVAVTGAVLAGVVASTAQTGPANPVTLQDLLHSNGTATTSLLVMLAHTGDLMSGEVIADYVANSFRFNPATAGRVHVVRATVLPGQPIVVKIAGLDGENEAELAAVQTTADETAGYERVPVGFIDDQGAVFAYGVPGR